MDRAVIEKIIDAANQAPSGSNSQPWRFVVREDKLSIISLPEKDHKILNFRNRGTHIAHGALIENIDKASRSLGYEPKFELHPTHDPFVSVTFNQVIRKDDDGLSSAIYKRCSNRKSYSKNPLSTEQKNFLFKDIGKFPKCELKIVEGEKINQIAQNLPNDILISLQNETLHKLLFQEVIWKEEEQKNRHGLYVKTMEVTPPKSFIFKLLSNWKIARFLNKAGIPKKVYQENIKTMSSAAMFGAITVEDKDESFVEAGGLMENIWLRAAKLDIGFHLITGILFLWQQANYGKLNIFSEAERNLINFAYDNVRTAFDVKNKIIALTFRIGEAEKPMAVSYKRPPQVEWR